MQRTVLALTGGTVGALVNSVEPPPGEPLPPEAAPPRDPRLPFVHPFPEHAVRRQQERGRESPPEPERSEPEPPAEPKKQADLPDAQERALRGFVAGAMVGLGAHMVMRVDSRKSAEAGATQNDPERVHWERMQEIRRQLDDQSRGRE